MAVNSARRISVIFTGSVAASLNYNAADNLLSPGSIDLITLNSGNNTITPIANATAVTIIPPDGNSEIITLKGVNGDTGVALHLTDPTSIGLGSISSFVLHVTIPVDNVRLIWS